jgi:RNA-splicing ligase RtcB
LDETQQVWLVLHSGSRGVGKDLAYLPEEPPEF